MDHPSYAAKDGRCRAYARALGALAGLFALRVAAQALHRWLPADTAPAGLSYRGVLPDGLLLAIQVFILALMISIACEVGAGLRRRNQRAARVLGLVGAIYLAGSLARIVAGLVLPHATPWFTAWVPALFHVVLALFIVTLAAYHATARPRVAHAATRVQASR